MEASFIIIMVESIVSVVIITLLVCLSLHINGKQIPMVLKLVCNALFICCFVCMAYIFYTYCGVARIYAVTGSGWFHYSEWQWSYKNVSGERFKVKPHCSYLYNETNRDVILYSVFYSLKPEGESVSDVFLVDTLRDKFIELHQVISYAFQQPEEIREVASGISTDTVYVIDFADKYTSKTELPNKTVRKLKWSSVNY